MTIAYLTDVEGRWDKLVSFATANPHVALVDGALQLAPGVTFVFGGDAVDRGPAGRRIVDVLLAAKRAYGERVVLLAGNRDINKLRLARELTGEPPPTAPAEVRASPPALLRWIFATTMGAPKAFGHRATELAAAGRPADDDAVVASYLADLAPGGPQRAYLHACQLGYRAGATLIVHGGVTAENLGVVPDLPRQPTVAAWLAALAQFYAAELAAFEAGASPERLLAYQRPKAGTHLNQASVVYARPTDELGNPHLPAADVIAQLAAEGIRRLVVGHTPSGDCPAILRAGDFELVLADNSYSRLELGSHVAFTDDETSVHATAELADGTRRAVRTTSGRADHASPLGRRLRATGQLVKAQLDTGDLLLFRGLAEHRVEQVAGSTADVLKCDLEAAVE